MPRFAVTIAQTKNYMLFVDASDKDAAAEVAVKQWREAYEVGKWRINEQQIGVESSVPVPP